MNSTKSNIANISAVVNSKMTNGGLGGTAIVCEAKQSGQLADASLVAIMIGFIAAIVIGFAVIIDQYLAIDNDLELEVKNSQVISVAQR